MTTLAVAFGLGAANVAETVIGLSGLAELVFVCTDERNPMLPLLHDLGEVVLAGGDLDDTARRLRELRPGGIVTFSDEVLMLAAELAVRLGLPFNDPVTTARLTSKELQRARLRECGVDNLPSRPLRTGADFPAAIAEVGYPAVLKPVHGAGSRDTYLLSGPADDRLAHDLLDGEVAFVLEEYLHGRPTTDFGDYVSVESLVTPERVQHFAISGKLPLVPPFRERGHIWPSTLDEHDEGLVKDLITRALRALGVRLGFTHTELKLTPTGPRIIEVNGRLGGGLNDLGRIAYGVDLVQIAGQVALGQPVPPIPERADRVHLNYRTLSPTAPFTLHGVHGTDALRRVPELTGYRLQSEAGQRYDASVESRFLDQISLVADDHAGLLAAIRRAREVLVYDIEFQSGERREFTGNDLARYTESELAPGR
ncbi:MAG TPA: ATP-grasp domain-containing protein [Jatrophihabitans sp.]|nr:ATP-grasp domain-containing protein [Jatrophihabitans sp.]